MQDAPPPCPRCSATHVVRNGATRGGVPSFRCRGCGRRFVAAPRKGPVPDADKAAVERMLAERLSLRAIHRITGRSRAWLQRFANDLYRRHTPHAPGRLKKTRPAIVTGWQAVGRVGFESLQEGDPWPRRRRPASRPSPAT